MSIDFFFSARRALGLTEVEHAMVHGIATRANDERREQWLAAYQDPKHPDARLEGYGRFSFSDLGRPQNAKQTPPYLFTGSVQLPLVDAWREVVLPLLEHWCQAFSEIRRQVPADRWSAHMDDFTMTWDDARHGYVLPETLTAEKYRASALHACAQPQEETQAREAPQPLKFSSLRGRTRSSLRRRACSGSRSSS